MSLNSEQQECVETTEGALLLVAGAGTGKTRVTTMRIANMIQTGIRPEEIAAVTFTNKAAKEMQERVGELVGSQARKLRIGTFHSFCLKILRKFSNEAGLPSKFGILSANDQLDLVKKALEEKGWLGQFKPEWILESVSKAKNALLSPEQIGELEFDHSYDNLAIAELYDLYERQLELNRVIDFDDCIYRTVKLFKQHPEVIKDLGIRYMLVDEYQDTNDSQLEVISAICDEHKNICVVGDDDQSIYSWRGANAYIFRNFKKRFPDAKTIKLEQNYRCSPTILNAANSVIKNNPSRNDKVLWSKEPDHAKINIKEFINDTEEAEAVAQKCMALTAQGIKNKDIAILYRTNAQTRAIEIALRELGVAYKVFGGQSFFERKEIKDLMAYVRLIVNPNDRMSFLRIINAPTRGVGLKTLEKLNALAQKNSLLDTLRHNQDVLSSKAKGKIADFFKSYDLLRSILPKTPEEVSSFSNKLIDEFRLKSYVRSQTADEMAKTFRLRLLMHTANALEKTAYHIREQEGTFTMSKLVDWLTLNPKGDDEEAGNVISLMTIHAAKGLEFPFVFLCGVEEGILPHKNSMGEDVFEERRLMYVALTRAKKQIYLSHCKERQLAKKIFCKSSRFIEEIPDDCIEQEGLIPVEEQKNRTLGKLSSLRESLKDMSKD